MEASQASDARPGHPLIRVMGHFVYILKSQKDGKFYTGYTQNVIQRLLRHNQGLVQSTRHRQPLELLYSESYATKNEALRRERYLKTLEGGPLKKELIAGVVQW